MYSSSGTSDASQVSICEFESTYVACRFKQRVYAFNNLIETSLLLAAVDGDSLSCRRHSAEQSTVCTFAASLDFGRDLRRRLLRSRQVPWGLHIQRSAGSSVRAGLGSYAVDHTLMPVIWPRERLRSRYSPCLACPVVRSGGCGLRLLRLGDVPHPWGPQTFRRDQASRRRL